LKPSGISNFTASTASNDDSHRQLSLDIIFLVSAANLKIAQFRSKKHPHCHFERQREILNNQDASSRSFPEITELRLSLLGMAMAYGTEQ